MKKLFQTLFALLAVATAGNAADVTELAIGYCEGKVVTTTHQEFCSKEKDTWVSGAIWLSADDVNVNKGNQISAIHAGLASKLSIDSLVVWVRTSLDGENLAQGSVAKNDLKKGWNTVALNQPVALDGQNQDGLYIGYSYHQTSSALGLSVQYEPTPNALYVQHGLDGEWTDRSGEGLLCVEGIVTGEQLPQLNLKLKSITLPEYYIIDKGVLALSGLVRNEAVKDVTGFDVETRIDGVDQVFTSHVDLTVAYGNIEYFEYEIQPGNVPIGEAKVTVTITDLTEGADENPSNNTASGNMKVAQHDYTRIMVLEEFTTESCPNCPRVAGFIHDLLEQGDYKQRVAALCHHSGYYTDWLTITADNSYTWYYNNGGSTYAPAVMVDRWTQQGNSTPVFLPQTTNDLKNYVDYRLSQPAFVSVNIKAAIDEENNVVNINVSGARSNSELTVNPARITVYLVENEIAAHSQAGASGEFIHQHVTRQVNSTWGDVIEWQDDEYSYDCSLRLRSDYVKENLQVVAFIYDYDNEHADQNVVCNAGQIWYENFGTTGIQDVRSSDTSSSTTVYDLQGRRLNSDNLRPGIYVVDGKKQVVK